MEALDIFICILEVVVGGGIALASVISTSWFESPRRGVCSIIAFVLTPIMLIPAAMLIKFQNPNYNGTHNFVSFFNGSPLNDFILKCNDWFPKYSYFNDETSNLLLGIGIIIAWFIITMILTGSAKIFADMDAEEERRVQEYNDSLEKDLRLETRFDYNDWTGKVTATSEVVDHTKYKSTGCSTFIIAPIFTVLGIYLLPVFSLSAIIIIALMSTISNVFG